MKRPATVLKNAALLLEKYGWIQGRLGDPYYGMCLVGAINYAAGGDSRAPSGDGLELRNRALDCLALALPKKYQEKVDGDAKKYQVQLSGLYGEDWAYYSVTEYNDTIGRRRGHVVKLLRRAAEECSQPKLRRKNG